MHLITQKLPLALLAVLALLLAGCGPEEALVWAPDGKYAVVSGDQGMVVDAAGQKLGAVLDEHEEMRAWLPDSQHLVIVRHVPARNWQEYAQLLGPERTRLTEQAAGEAAALIGSYHDDWRKFGESPLTKAWSDGLEARGLELLDVAYFLQQTRPQLLAPLLEAERQIRAEEAAKEAAPPADTATQESRDTLFREDHLLAYIAELRIRQAVPPNPAADRLLVRSADAIEWAAPSPSGRVIAFAQEEPTHDQLYVIAAQPGALPVLVDTGANWAAWPPDGQDLAYAKVTVPRAQQQGNMQLASIARRRVCAPAGEVLGTMEAAEDLAGLILPGPPARLAWLPDGRILFASAPFSLPATTADLPKDLTLFALRLLPSPTIERLIPAALQPLLPDRLDLFTVSPDGKKVALLGRDGAVSVFFLETGALLPLQSDLKALVEDSNFDALVPAWRSSDELTFVVPAGDPAGSAHRAEVVIGTLSGGKRAISKAWPDAKFLPPLK